jgi:hypothetical protein
MKRDPLAVANSSKRAHVCIHAALPGHSIDKCMTLLDCVCMRGHQQIAGWLECFSDDGDGGMHAAGSIFRQISGSMHSCVHAYDCSMMTVRC